MKIWIYMEQNKDWEMVAECSHTWAYWVAMQIQSANPELKVMYGTEKPLQPLIQSFHNR